MYTKHTKIYKLENTKNTYIQWESSTSPSSRNHRKNLFPYPTLIQRQKRKKKGERKRKKKLKKLQRPKRYNRKKKGAGIRLCDGKAQKKLKSDIMDKIFKWKVSIFLLK